VDITRDVMKKYQAKVPTAQIRRDIDASYGKSGKPMPVPLPK
jgi:hypothetical protein